MSSNVTIEVLTDAAARKASMAGDVQRGLTAEQPSIPPAWFYDETGSLLFDEISRLPEYYLTRAEGSVLAANAASIVAAAEATTLVEIGSGTSEKTRLILDAMSAAGTLRSVVLMDISEEVLVAAAEELSGSYDVAVKAVVGDIRTDLGRLAIAGPSLWAFLGSTIGNFDPAGRSALLRDFRRAMQPGDTLLLGTDLVKPVERLLAAYNDSAGVTAAFNLNVLSVLGSELGADFDPASFEHVAEWNEAEDRIEMRLRALDYQMVHVADLDLKLSLGAGESILTEISSKFDQGRVTSELSGAGLSVEGQWTDAAGDFLVTLARAARR